METSATSGKIIINFGWLGHSSLKDGLEVGVVDLIFQNAKSEISASIPSNISPTTVKKLPFTYRKYQYGEVELNGRKVKLLDKETHPDLLSVTIEQIRNLTIKAGIFEKSSASMDCSGKITYKERILRSDRPVKLDIPNKLEPGQKYCLVVTSDDNLSLSARLRKVNTSIAKPASTKEEDAKFKQNQDELFKLLGGLLLPPMGLKVMAFGVMLQTAPSGRSLVINTNFTDRTFGIRGIKDEIAKIDQETLAQLMKKVEASKSEWERRPLKRLVLEKAGIKACFDVISTEGLKNMMRSNLEALVSGPIPPDVKKIIEDLADKFKESCIRNVT